MGWRWKLAMLLCRIAARLVGWRYWKFEEDYGWQRVSAKCYTDAGAATWWV